MRSAYCNMAGDITHAQWWECLEDAPFFESMRPVTSACSDDAIFATLTDYQRIPAERADATVTVLHGGYHLATIAKLCRELGSPTHGDLAALVWRLSCDEKIPSDVAREFMRDAGYTPFKGYPLKETEPTVPTTLQVGWDDKGSAVIAYVPMDHTFHGVACTEAQFAEWRKSMDSGKCPWCGRDEIENRFQNRNRHLAACRRRLGLS